MMYSKGIWANVHSPKAVLLLVSTHYTHIWFPALWCLCNLMEWLNRLRSRILTRNGLWSLDGCPVVYTSRVSTPTAKPTTTFARPEMQSPVSERLGFLPQASGADIGGSPLLLSQAPYMTIEVGASSNFDNDDGGSVLRHRGNDWVLLAEYLWSLLTCLRKRYPQV